MLGEGEHLGGLLVLFSFLEDRQSPPIEGVGIGAPTEVVAHVRQQLEVVRDREVRGPRVFSRMASARSKQVRASAKSPNERRT
jgi:hypothetical protein